MAIKKSKSKRPVILITNDDGINAPGIRHLIKLMKTLGEVVVVAPDKPQSGMAHAITIATPLRLEKITTKNEITEYSCNGTPVDCVKLAICQVLSGKPDLIVSGINHGSNASVNVIYSGTMSAVVEGAIEGIPSIGFSINNYSLDADFTPADSYILSIAKSVLQNGIPGKACLNVNIPVIKKIKGVKVCRQSEAYWSDEYEVREDPHHKKYYWLKGDFVSNDTGKETDQWALKNGYISIVPVQCDFTAHHAISKIKYLEK